MVLAGLYWATACVMPLPQKLITVCGGTRTAAGNVTLLSRRGTYEMMLRHCEGEEKASDQHLHFAPELRLLGERLINQRYPTTVPELLAYQSTIVKKMLQRL